MGGCNGAGKTTFARELLPRLGVMRFLNVDEMARGLSPLDPTLNRVVRLCWMRHERGRAYEFAGAFEHTHRQV